jgi:hypothetical protein
LQHTGTSRPKNSDYEEYLEMNIFQQEKIGERATPEFDEEVVIFIDPDVLLLEFENCSQKQYDGSHVHCNVYEESSVRKQIVEEWSGVAK